MTRDEIAIQNIAAFSVYASGKLPAHVLEDLRIVCRLAASGMEARSVETAGFDPKDDSPVGAAETPKQGGSRI